MESSGGQSPAPTTVDWKEVQQALKGAGPALDDAATKLSSARELVLESADRSAPELDLLKEELDDVRGRFESLKETLDSQSGPVVEAADEPADEDDG